MSLDEAAVLAWVNAGYSIFAVGPRKEPAGGRWTGGPDALAQTQPATLDEARDMAAHHQGIAAAAGKASGNAEMFEVEGRAAREGYADRLRETMRDHGREDLLDHLLAGCVAQSPSGGFHIWFRTEGPPLGNRKLARRPLKPEEEAALRASLAEQGRTEAEIERIVARAYETLIETRGQGGYAVLPPSGGVVHPDGGAWTLLPGTSPADTPTISIEDRDFLYGMAGLLDEIPDPTEHAPSLQSVGHTEPRDGKRPGDDFEERATWEEILEPAGWRKGRRLHGDGQGWVRPGKEARDGISGAVVNLRIGRRFVPYSSSTLLEPFKQYSKFALYVALEHDGNFSDASRALRKAGYGDPDKPRDQTADLRGLIADVPTVEGTLAVVRELRPRAGDYSADDDGNALRLVDTHGRHLRRITDMGRWMTWDGARWHVDHDEAIVRNLARELARGLPEAEKADKTWKHNSLSSAGLTSCVRVAASDPRVTIPTRALDASTTLLNTPTGVVDLVTGELQPHNPDDLLTRMTTVGVDLDAPHPQWDAFLAETFGGDAEMVSYLQRLAGLILRGDVTEHVLPLWYGTGANGKGALALVWQHILGDGDSGGYAVSAPDGFLMGGRDGAHPTEIARIRGARLVIASEQSSGKRFDEAKVKRLTGGDMLTGRFMRGDFFDFAPSHVIVVLTNHLPTVKEGGPGFWRRARLIPFEHVVPPESRVPDLDKRLVDAEGPAILGWMIRGALAVAEGGLADPAKVLAATDDYRVSEDTLASFLRDECLLGAGHWVTSAEFFRRYEVHCRQMGAEALSAKAIGMRLRSEFEVSAARLSRPSRHVYQGVGLLADDEEEGS